MRRITPTLIIPSALLVSVLVAATQAQDLPADLPGGGDPAQTQPAQPRHVAQVPPGFKRLQIEGREFFVPPEEEAWLAPAVQRSEPPQMPTTMPADLLASLNARRQAIEARMVRDLGLSPADVEEFFDRRLKVFLQQMDELRPPIIYLVTSPQELKDAMKAGWTDPRYHYNRAADDVNFSTVVNLSVDDAGDDMVLPLLFDPALPPEQRQQRVIKEMSDTENSILNAVSQRAQAMVMVAMVELISQKVLDPLELKSDQEWFGVGVAGVLSARYTAMLIGLDEQRLLADMMNPDPRNPMRPDTLDLLHPTELRDVRPEWINAYTDAYRRRSMQVVWKLLSEGDEGAIVKVIDAMKQNPPADGPALVRLIRQTTGVDLSGQLGPKRS